MKSIVLSLDKKFKKEEEEIKKTLKVLNRLLSLQNKQVEVYVVGDSFMRKNVLSFEAPKDFPRPDLKTYENLGEIYLNPDHIKRQGEDLSYMLVHGLLHLLGYDHKNKSDRIKMENKEREICQQINS